MRTRRRAAPAASPGKRLALAEVSPAKKNASDGQRETFSSPVVSTRKRLALRTSGELAQMAAECSPLKAFSVRPMRNTRPTRKAKAAQDQLGLRRPAPQKTLGSERGPAQQAAKQDSSTEESDNEKENVAPLRNAALASTPPPSRRVFPTEPRSPTAEKSSLAEMPILTAMPWRGSSPDSMAELEADYVMPASSTLVRSNSTATHTELPLSSTPLASPLGTRRQPSPVPALGRSILDDGMLSDGENMHGRQRQRRDRVAQQDSVAQRQDQLLLDNKLARVESYLRSTDVARSEAHMSRPPPLKDHDAATDFPDGDHQSITFSSDEDEFGFFAAVKKGKTAARQGIKTASASTKKADETQDEDSTQHACLPEADKARLSVSFASSVSSLSDAESEDHSPTKEGDDAAGSQGDSESDSSDIFSDLAKKTHKRQRSSKANPKTGASFWKVDDLVKSVFPRRHAAVKGKARGRRRGTNNDDQESDSDGEPSPVAQSRSQRGKKGGRSSGREVSKARKRGGVSEKPAATATKASDGPGKQATRMASRKAPTPESDAESALTELSSDEDGASKATKKRERDELDDYALGEEWVI